MVKLICKAMNIQPVVVVCLVMAFGMFSWLSVNSVWVELPLLVNKLPEGWNLPTYLALLVQVASLSPIILGVMIRCFPVIQRHLKHIIYIILLFGSVEQILLTIFWDNIATVSGNAHSLALLALFFLLSLVSTTTDVTFLPFMQAFKPHYVTWYFVGMSLSNLIPSIIALGQGAGDVFCVNTTNSSSNISQLVATEKLPTFSVTPFFACTSALMIASVIGFAALNQLTGTRSEMVEEDNFVEPDDIKKVKPEDQLVNCSFVTILLLTAYICSLLNGVLPSISSYSSGAYGQTSYHYSVILSNIASPIGSFIPFIFPRAGLPLIYILTLLFSAAVSYTIALAALSPVPPLLHTVAGESIMILCSIAVSGLGGYLRTVMAQMLRASQRKHALLMCGILTQAGSMVGALILFPLVNEYNLFQSPIYC